MLKLPKISTFIAHFLAGTLTIGTKTQYDFFSVLFDWSCSIS